MPNVTLLLRLAGGLAAVALVLSCTVSSQCPALIGQLERWAYDARVRMRLPAAPDSNVALVVVDERSIEAEGRWPWSRRRMGDLLDALFEHYAVSLVGLDLQFPKAEVPRELAIVEDLARELGHDSTRTSAALVATRERLDHDRYFAERLAKYPVVLAYAFALGSPDGKFATGVLHPPALPRRHPPLALDTVNSYTGNLELFERSAKVGAGHTRPALDPDGAIRRLPLLVAYEDGYYEAFGLAVARAHLEARQVDVALAPDQPDDAALKLVAGVTLADRTIPTDHFGFALIPYHGRAGTFQRISATDVLAGRVDPAALRDRIVLVGVTAHALGDLKATPVGKEFPGVEVHANVVEGILGRSFLAPNASLAGHAGFAVLLVTLALALGVPFVRPRNAFALFAGAVVALVVLEHFAWTTARVPLPIAAPLIALGTIGLTNLTIGYVTRSRAFDTLAHLFGQYVPRELVREMARSPDRYLNALAGENREMTVLFSDVRDFTSIAERLNPTELRQLMNAYLTPMTECVLAERGTIDKYIGDAVMAFWGAPLHDAEHATHAVRAALAMQARMRSLNAQFVERGLPPLKIGVGLSSGLMSVGDMGSAFRRSFTVLGDTVNLASRIEGLTKQYGVGILVTEAVVAQTRNIVYREIDRVIVKGKTVEVRIFEPIGAVDQVPAERIDQIRAFEQGLAARYARDFTTAKASFRALTSRGIDVRLCAWQLARMEIESAQTRLVASTDKPMEASH